MGFLDRRGRAEYPYPRDDVLEALGQAILTIKRMKIDKADKPSGHILVKAEDSMPSDENMSITVTEINQIHSRIEIVSKPKTGAFLGGVFDLGKNRRNIEKVLEATSKILRALEPEVEDFVRMSRKIPKILNLLLMMK